MSDFPQEALTPEYDYYEDWEEGSPDFLDNAPPEELTPVELAPEPEDTPEASDNVIGAEVMLPRGGTLTRGRVIRRKRDHEGNAKGRANVNPILDTREFIVEFENGEVDELTANRIAQSMIAMCDEEGRQILVFDDFVDWRRHDDALTLHDQCFVDC